MNIQSVVQNDLIQDASSVWLLKDHTEFGYSDGAKSEKYLERVLRNATDLSTRSSELQQYIKDWPSEYHLTTKRAQLLAGFEFDRSLRVLEVGCGCGAITRHLGESFDSVVSVEGSLKRARLARLRTRDLKSVSIVCAPFQDIRFSQKFDVIFCIGVYEYSASFIAGDDPYDAALQYFADMLTPDGMVVIAIENQFGLKYFSSAREDHLGVMFEGLEGYHSHSLKVRTFGKAELERRLSKYFRSIQFYYPYPDYKLPDCVLSDDFVASGRAGEIVSQMKSRDYAGQSKPMWDEASTTLELARNGMLGFFSNSFLILAGKDKLNGVFDQQGILYSSSRKSRFATQTRILNGSGNQLVVRKRSLQGLGGIDSEALTLLDTESPWVDSQSLQTSVFLRSKSRGSNLDAIFEPCRQWAALLDSVSTTHDGVRYLGGEHIDSIWPNVYPEAEGYRLVDREWVWKSRVRMNAVIIRAIYDFLSKIEDASSTARALETRSGRALIRSIASAIGVALTSDDFDEFIKLESELQAVVFGVDTGRQAIFLRWFLLDRPSLRFIRRVKTRGSSLLENVRARLVRWA